jgi:hypothetical protein
MAGEEGLTERPGACYECGLTTRQQCSVCGVWVCEDCWDAHIGDDGDYADSWDDEDDEDDMDGETPSIYDYDEERHRLAVWNATVTREWSVARERSADDGG